MVKIVLTDGNGCICRNDYINLFYNDEKLYMIFFILQIKYGHIAFFQGPNHLCYIKNHLNP